MSRLLLVDDEISCLEPLSKLFKLEGFEVITACDGLEGLEVLREQPVDLVLLDLIMPRMNGVQFLEELRKDPAYDALPIILVTGQHEARLQARALQLRIKEYLFKAATPFQKMLAIVQQNLGQTPRSGGAPRPRHHRKKA